MFSAMPFRLPATLSVEAWFPMTMILGIRVFIPAYHGFSDLFSPPRSTSFRRTMPGCRRCRCHASRVTISPVSVTLSFAGQLIATPQPSRWANLRAKFPAHAADSREAFRSPLIYREYNGGHLLPARNFNADGALLMAIAHDAEHLNASMRGRGE